MSGPLENGEKPARGLYGQRPSKSADAARREQIAEELAMSPRERVLLALRLGRRMKRLQQAVQAAREAKLQEAGSDD